MSITLATLLARTKAGAGLTNNTPAGEMATGVGGAATETTDQFLTRVFNDGQNLLARCGAAPLDSATLSWPISQRSARLATFTPATAGRVLFAVTGMKWGGTALEVVRRDVLDLHDPSYRAGTIASGTPALYFADGEEAGLYAPPSTLATATAYGYFLPAPITSMVDFTLLSDDGADALVSYGIERLALKNGTDPDLAERAAPHMGLFDEACLRLWTGLPKLTRLEYFADAPIAMKGSPKK
jgi:hypothetical protein